MTSNQRRNKDIQILCAKRLIYGTAKNEVRQILQLMTTGHRCCKKNSLAVNPFYKRTKK